MQDEQQPALDHRSEPQGQIRDLALHTLGWKAFQDLCAQICQELLATVVSVYREAQDGGQDAVFLLSNSDAEGSEDGTVQCKFSSDSKRRFKVSDIHVEADNIRALVAQKQAQTYFFLTSMSVDAPEAAKAREYIRGFGVVKPFVLGREWITQQISCNPKLRALVPRVYGLGDLATILDERAIEQTRTLIGHLLPQLRLYVPTTAHRYAVRTLSEYGIVLLLGPPACGKSMLAAILSASALDVQRRRTFRIDTPKDLVKHWDPNSSDAFYWIDDAFGANQLRSDYVDEWISIMSRVAAAAAHGNKFVLTSRSHIWVSAMKKLGTRNHPRLADSAAVVRLGTLSHDERAQILYNHIKFGSQSRAWKEQVKPYLPPLADEENFLPEIARRLGNRLYTGGIRILPRDLFRFVAMPMEFLKETLEELTTAQQAALTLVFLHRSGMPASAWNSESLKLVEEAFGAKPSEIGEAIEQLTESFLLRALQDGSAVWRFAHPTIADAIAAILTQRVDRLELYLRGAQLGLILAQATCTENASAQDAVLLPPTLWSVLASRLAETPNEPHVNGLLFTFLSERASRPVISDILDRDGGLLHRACITSGRAIDDPRIRFCARLQIEGLLPTRTREQLTQDLVEAISARFDGSFLDDDDILGLMLPTRLLELSTLLPRQILSDLQVRLEQIDTGSDQDRLSDDYFEDLITFLTAVQKLFRESDLVLDDVNALKRHIRKLTRTLSDNRTDATSTHSDAVPVPIAAESKSRSIFSDLMDGVE